MAALAWPLDKLLPRTLDARGLADVTHGGGLDDVAHDESLDRLVLGNRLPRGHAPHAVDVAAALLVASVAAALDDHGACWRGGAAGAWLSRRADASRSRCVPLRPAHPDAAARAGGEGQYQQNAVVAPGKHADDVLVFFYKC